MGNSILSFEQAKKWTPGDYLYSKHVHAESHYWRVSSYCVEQTKDGSGIKIRMYGIDNRNMRVIILVSNLSSKATITVSDLVTGGTVVNMDHLRIMTSEEVPPEFHVTSEIASTHT
jgi:hypothetical protein